MKDTPLEIEDRYRVMLMARSGAERLFMGFDMFDASRALVRAGLGIGDRCDGDAKVQLFLRTYGSDFDEKTIARISERLRKSSV